MPYLLRGALIEYATDFLGPIPNVVIFQFNPESLTRNIEIPPRPTGSGNRETSQAGEVPVERISLTAYFSAADQLSKNEPLARLYGVGHRLAALEKMVRPSGEGGGVVGELLDAVGDALGGSSEAEATQPIPREQYPRVLFIWGQTRVMPVIIDSMSITEQEYDHLLNPVRAEVSIGLAALTIDSCVDDKVARGAAAYTQKAKNTQAESHLVQAVAEVVDLIPI